MSHPYGAFAKALGRAWQNPGRFMLALAGMVGIGMIDPMLVLYTRKVVDQYFMDADRSRAIGGVVMFSGIFVVRGMLVFGTGRIMAALAADVLVDIQREIFAIKRHVHGRDGKPGQVLIALLSEAKQSTDLIEKVVVKYIRSSINLVALLISLAYLQPLVAQVCVLTLLPTIAVCRLLGRRYHVAATAYVRSNHDLLQYCADAAKATSLLTRLGIRLDRQLATGEGLARNVASNYGGMYFRAGTFVPLTQMFLGLALVGLVYFIRTGVLQADAGTLAALVTNIFLIQAPLRDLTEAHAAVLRGAIGQQWIDAGKEQDPAAVAPGDLADDDAVLQISHRDPAWERGPHRVASAGRPEILEGPEAGEIMRALESAMEGRADPAWALTWKGLALARLPLQALAQQCFYSNSAVPIFETDIASNIACDTRPHRAQVEAALDAVGLSAWLASLPDGVNTLIGSNGVKLSGGQRQLLGIARALYLKRPLTVLSDPTSALDPAAERVACDALRRLAQGCTVVIHSTRPALRAMARLDEETRHVA